MATFQISEIESRLRELGDPELGFEARTDGLRELFSELPAETLRWIQEPDTAPAREAYSRLRPLLDAYGSLSKKEFDRALEALVANDSLTPRERCDGYRWLCSRLPMLLDNKPQAYGALLDANQTLVLGPGGDWIDGQNLSEVADGAVNRPLGETAAAGPSWDMQSYLDYLKANYARIIKADRELLPWEGEQIAAGDGPKDHGIAVGDGIAPFGAANLAKAKIANVVIAEFGQSNLDGAGKFFADDSEDPEVREMREILERFEPILGIRWSAVHPTLEHFDLFNPRPDQLAKWDRATMNFGADAFAATFKRYCEARVNFLSLLRPGGRACQIETCGSRYWTDHAGKWYPATNVSRARSTAITALMDADYADRVVSFDPTEYEHSPFSVFKADRYTRHPDADLTAIRRDISRFSLDGMLRSLDDVRAFVAEATQPSRPARQQVALLAFAAEQIATLREPELRRAEAFDLIVEAVRTPPAPDRHRLIDRADAQWLVYELRRLPESQPATRETALREIATASEHAVAALTAVQHLREGDPHSQAREALSAIPEESRVNALRAADAAWGDVALIVGYDIPGTMSEVNRALSSRLAKLGVPPNELRASIAEATLRRNADQARDLAHDIGANFRSAQHPLTSPTYASLSREMVFLGRFGAELDDVVQGFRRAGITDPQAMGFLLGLYASQSVATASTPAIHGTLVEMGLSRDQARKTMREAGRLYAPAAIVQGH